MRRIRLGVVTDAVANPDGSGLSFGTGEKIRAEDSLLIYLAGIAVEADYGFVSVDLEQSRFDDLDAARTLLDVNR